MSPYRGFVELPRAVFDAARDIGRAFEAAIAERAAPAPAPRRPSVYATLDEGVEAFSLLLEHRGFVKVQLQPDPLRTDLRLRAVHRCGSVCAVRVRMRSADPWQPVLDAVDSMGCYCVRRGP